MQAVKSENKRLSHLVLRWIIIVLLGAVMVATMNMGMTAYASERMVSTEDVLHDIETIKTSIKADDGSVTIAGGNKIIQFGDHDSLKWEVELPSNTIIQALSEAGDGGLVFAGIDHNFKFYYGRVNEQGELLWANSYDSAAAGSANAIYPHGSDTYIVIGDYREALGGQVKPLIQLVDSTGGVVGNNLSPIMDNSLNQNIYHALPLANGDYLLLGNLGQVSSPNVALAARVSGLEGSLGEVRWSHTYSKADQHFSFQRASAVSINGETFYLITGNMVHTASGQRATLSLLDENGNEQWTKTFDQVGSGGIAIDAAMTRDGGFVLVGGDNGRNGFLIKTDKEGNEQWRKVFPNTGNIRQVEENADGSYTMAGGFFSGGGIFWHKSVGQPTDLRVDHASNRILGLNEKMEYSTDGGVHYEKYNPDDEPVFNGTVDVYVRYAEDLANGFEAGPPAILSFMKQPIELEDGQVFNQSGRSYSGVINSTPLGKEIEMSAYDKWPEGFTKGVQAFSGAVYDGEYIWMIPYRADRVIRFHPTTGQMAGYAAWPEGYDPGPDHFANGAFLGGVFDGESIWLIPYDANMVVQLNPETGEMTGYNAWPDGVSSGYKFSGGYFDGEVIILVPHNSKALVELNPATGEMKGYHDWPEGLQWGLNGSAFASSVFDGENVWMLPYEANQVVKFNTVTKEMTGYDDAPEGVNPHTTFIGGAYDGERIWMAPLTTEYVIAIDSSTGHMSKYEIWPEGEEPTPSSYNSMFYDGEAVWLIPYNQDAFMRIDPHTGEATLHGNWPEEFNKGFSSFFASVSDGEHVWAIPFSADQVIRLSSTSIPVIEKMTEEENTLTLVFDGKVTLDSLEGFTIEINGEQIALDDVIFGVDPENKTHLIFTLPEGTQLQDKKVSVSYDGKGNLKGTNGIPVNEFTLENRPPSIEITEPSDDEIDVPKPVVKGNAEPGSEVSVVMIDEDGTEITGEVEVDEDGNWTFIPSHALTDGPYSIVATAANGGKTTTVTKNVTVEIPEPVLSITRPSGDTVTETQPTFEGTATPGAKVTVKITDNIIGEVIADEDGNWSFTPDTELATGQTYHVEVTAEKHGKETTLNKEIKVVADKAALEHLVKEIEKEELDQADYTSESWSALEDALKKAEEVLNDPGATQEEVDAALKALEKARDGLVKKKDTTKPAEVDKSALKELVDKANSLVQTDYTSASWKALDKALKDAEKVLNDPHATQKEVDKALQNLKSAYEGLVLLDRQTDQLEPDNEEPNKQESIKQEEGKKLPKTATNIFNYMVAGSLILLIGFFLLRLASRKRIQ